MRNLILLLMTEIWLSHMSSVASNTCLSSLTEVLAHLSTVSPLNPFCMPLMVMSIQPDGTHMWPTAGKKFAQHYQERNTLLHRKRNITICWKPVDQSRLTTKCSPQSVFSHIAQYLSAFAMCFFSESVHILHCTAGALFSSSTSHVASIGSENT